jgi:lysophospholipase L1-like esterase
MIVFAALFALLMTLQASALEWRTSWTASVQGPYPVGYPMAQPDLSLAFPDPEQGAVDQSFRMLVKPNIWGDMARIRFTNAYGAKPLTIDGAFAGLHQAAGAIVAGTNTPVTFGGGKSVTIPPGGSAWSDAVALPFAKDIPVKYLYGKKLAVSLHVAGESGPMTWHALGLSTNYISWPRAGSLGSNESDAAFPFSAVSWFFVDAVDMLAPSETKVVVCLGDSITDGHYSTINGDDRWPDELSRFMHAKYGNSVSVVNAGISGNEVVGPDVYGPDSPYNGGPSVKDRLERDLLSLSGVSAVLWLEGINDLHTGGRSAKEVENGMRDTVQRIRRAAPGVRIFACTLVSSKNSTIGEYGAAAIDAKRRELNAFIRSTDIFDGVIEFDAATLDPETGMLRPAYGPDSSFGLEPDWLHPNRAGLLKMAEAIDLEAILP